MPLCIGTIAVGSFVFFAGYQHAVEILFAQIMFVVVAGSVVGLATRVSARRAADREADARDEWFRANYARSAALVRNARGRR